MTRVLLLASKDVERFRENIQEQGQIRFFY
jgi:hypothetical protein